MYHVLLFRNLRHCKEREVQLETREKQSWCVSTLQRRQQWVILRQSLQLWLRLTSLLWIVSSFRNQEVQRTFLCSGRCIAKSGGKERMWQGLSCMSVTLDCWSGLLALLAADRDWSTLWAAPSCLTGTSAVLSIGKAAARPWCLVSGTALQERCEPNIVQRGNRSEEKCRKHNLR